MNNRENILGKKQPPPQKCRGLLDNTKRAKICIFKITEGEEKED